MLEPYPEGPSRPDFAPELAASESVPKNGSWSIHIQAEIKGWIVQIADYNDQVTALALIGASRLRFQAPSPKARRPAANAPGLVHRTL